MTQDAAAKELGCKQAKIHKIEAALVGISTADLDKLLGVYNVNAEKASELRQLAADEARRPRPRSEPRSVAFRRLIEYEEDAREILVWVRETIPGPLQSEQYMLAQFKADKKPTCEVVQLIREHNARTRIFTMDDPPDYRVILSESSLCRLPGGRSPQLLLDQVEHLLTAIRTYPSLAVHILTFDAVLPFAHNDFVVVHLPDDEDSLAYVEYPGDGRTINDVTPLEAHWYELHRAALTKEETVEFLERLAKETRDKWQITTDQWPFDRDQ